MKHQHEHHSHSSGEHQGHHGFDDTRAVVERLESPERDAWQKPEEVIASLQLSGNETVAEIGAGTGYFVVRIARHLGEGTVIGLDTEPNLVAYLRQRAIELGLANIDARLVQSSEALPLVEQVDLLLCVDTYHHVPDRVAYFSSYAEHLKPGGKLVIIDRPLDAPEGPPADHRISAEIVVVDLAHAGFTLIGSEDFLQPYQYYLVFTPSDSGTESP